MRALCILDVAVLPLAPPPGFEERRDRIARQRGPRSPVVLGVIVALCVFVFRSGDCIVAGLEGAGIYKAPPPPDPRRLQETLEQTLERHIEPALHDDATRRADPRAARERDLPRQFDATRAPPAGDPPQ